MVKLSCIDVDEQEDLALPGVAVAVLEDEKELETLKDMLDKTSKEESEYQNIDDDGDDNNEEQDEEKSSRIAFCDLEKLPERIPESWYAYDLEGNDEEEASRFTVRGGKTSIFRNIY